GRSMLGRTSGWLLVTARNRACRVPDLEGGRQLRHAPPDGPWPDCPGLRCFALTSLFAAWPLMALVWERWGSDPVHPRALGLAPGVAGGGAAAGAGGGA